MVGVKTNQYKQEIGMVKENANVRFGFVRRRGMRVRKMSVTELFLLLKSHLQQGASHTSVGTPGLCDIRCACECVCVHACCFLCVGVCAH